MSEYGVGAALRTGGGRVRNVGHLCIVEQRAKERRGTELRGGEDGREEGGSDRDRERGGGGGA